MNRAVHQLPLSTSLRPDDQVPIVREVTPGDYIDARINAGALGASILERTTTVGPAQWLTINATPVELVPASNGRTIIPFAMRVAWSGITTPYATNTSARVYGLNSVINSHYWAAFNINLAADDTLLVYTQTGAFHRIGVSDAVLLSVNGGNPTAGDGTAQITVYYTMV